MSWGIGFACQRSGLDQASPGWSQRLWFSGPKQHSQIPKINAALLEPGQEKHPTWRPLFKLGAGTTQASVGSSQCPGIVKEKNNQRHVPETLEEHAKHNFNLTSLLLHLPWKQKHFCQKSTARFVKLSWDSPFLGGNHKQVLGEGPVCSPLSAYDEYYKQS